MDREAGANAQPNPECSARYRWAARAVAGKSVLDAGCGKGWGTALLARQAEAAVGVDFSPAAIADARRDHGELAGFVEGDLRDLPFEAGEFECVVCFEALVHVAEPAPVLDELRRVLVPEGTLLVSAPNRGVYPPGNPLHMSELAPAELERLLGARFAHVALYRQHGYFASLLGPATMLERGDGSEPIAVEPTKLSGTPAGGELHAVAAASDGDLPPAPAELVLGEPVDYNEQQALLEEWRDRAIQAEATALARSRELRALRP